MDRQQDFLKHFLRHQDDLRAFIGSIVRDRHACDDILQEVALVLWQKFDAYDPARSFGGWARGIAANKIMQSFAKAKRVPDRRYGGTRLVMYKRQDDVAAAADEGEG